VQGDRGRGKSALIGRAVKEFRSNNSAKDRTISLCATRRSACDVLLKHADQTIPFLSIQHALKTQHDVLLVEEAGSIPIAILEKLLSLSQTIVFATTVQGYEGAGRGFAIRFAKRLNSIAPDRLVLKPVQPVRWSAGDPVEAFINDVFLLENDITALPATRTLAPSSAKVEQIDAINLLGDESLLKDIYGLLVQAHYQTTPADLRNILDKQSLLVFAQRCEGVLTGAALVALEGNISIPLHTPIVEKKRRLHDQIIPQLLAQSAGQGHGLGSRYARIVRIAVHPAIQQQGFGTHLFKQITQILATRIDCVGASFGANESTLSFWLKLGLTPIHYGYRTNPRSGLRSACLATGYQSEMKNIIADANQVLQINTRALNEYAELSDPVMQKLIEAAGAFNISVNENTVKELLSAYAIGNRGFIDTAGLLLEFVPLAEEQKLLSDVRNTLAHYSQRAPAARRIAEAEIRAQLSVAMS